MTRQLVSRRAAPERFLLSWHLEKIFPCQIKKEELR
jgi:hypothetical protein